MALISGFGGTLVFSGSTTVKCRSFTMSTERESLEVTLIGDWRKKFAPGRVRISGTVTLFRQDTTVDAELRKHLFPTTLLLSVTATLTLKFTDQGGVVYNNTMDGGSVDYNVQITSATFSDDGSGAGTWELSWEAQ
jgi:hypothetical protein